MDTLLAYNDDFALLGDMEGRIRTEQRPADVSPKEWQERLQLSCHEPEHGYKDNVGVAYRHRTGDYVHNPGGGVTLQAADGIKPYQTYTDAASGLSIRVTFLAYGREWYVADLEPDDEL